MLILFEKTNAQNIWANNLMAANFLKNDNSFLKKNNFRQPFKKMQYEIFNVF